MKIFNKFYLIILISSLTLCSPQLNDAEKLFFLYLLKNNNLLEIEKFIKEKRIDLNDAGRLGFLPLAVASEYGNPETLQLLLDYGADVDARQNNKDTALMVTKDIDNFKFLLKNGAETEIKDATGHTALHIKAFCSTYIEHMKLLIEYGANLNSKTDMGLTPIFGAIAQNNYKGVKTLIEAGADINIHSKSESSPLEYSLVFSKDPKITKLLLESGAEIDSNYSPLPSIASSLVSSYKEENWKNKIEMIDILLKEGVTINSTTRYGFTIFHVAVGNKHYDLLEILKKRYNPDITIKDNEGRNVFDYARELHGEEVEKKVRKLLLPEK